MAVTTYYLEMRQRPVAPPDAPDGLRVVTSQKPTIKFYRFLYDAVGEPWDWIDRKKLSDDELAAIIHDPLVEVSVLYAQGTPAGYIELDRRVEGDVELAYFGIMPEFIGQRLGPWFLAWGIQRAWTYAHRRVWVHTCTLDHPAALKTYKRAGFEQYDERTE